MSTRIKLGTCAALILMWSNLCLGQRGAVPDSQLRTDPFVGNVQGNPRFQRELRSDPEMEFGFSNYQYGGGTLGFSDMGGFGLQALGGGAANMPLVPFDATTGLRNPPPGAGQFGLQSIDASGGTSINAQPLIQVRVRVVDVLRNDTFASSSVLDYVSSIDEKFSYIVGNNINNDFQNLRGSTRFSVPGLLGVDGTALNTGTGLLLNLTSEHINYITSLLATSFEGDVVTAPEVTTLNGQNVEFMAGAKLPFELGQSVTTESATNIQQFFYKHVGTYISVTPRIVNWGPNGEGHGRVDKKFVRPEELPFQAVTKDDIPVYPALLTALKHNAALNAELTEDFQKNTLDKLPLPIDDALKTSTVAALNSLLKKKLEVEGNRVEIDRFVLSQMLGDTVLPPQDPECSDCDWSPNDCTIDLEVVVRLSNEGSGGVSGVMRVDEDGEPVAAPMTIEDNVRAISNIVQVKSGHGVVMAGLIGETDTEVTSKVPVLGDLPFVGYLFRAKDTNRAKTETLIFVEARVLDREPAITRAQSYQDFELGKAYVEGEFLDNPLEYGMYRAGFGTYLPPHSVHECMFWEQHDRTVRKVATEISDAILP